MGEVEHSGWSERRIAVAAAHVFVDDLDAPALRDDDAHHLNRVLRLRDGELVTLGDGAGRWRRAAMTGGRVVPIDEAVVVVPAAQPVTVVFALTKGDKPELTVEKLTELGVDRIVPVVAERSIVRWDADKAARNAQRFRAVSRAAAMQSRRAFLPQIADVSTLAVVAANTPELVAAHPDGPALGDAAAAVAIGPEGGWTDAEVAVCHGTVDLGPTTLRAETAALAAGALLVALRDGRVRATGPI